jgi:hypothetical protein
VDRFVQITVLSLEKLKFHAQDLDFFHTDGLVHGFT